MTFSNLNIEFFRRKKSPTLNENSTLNNKKSPTSNDDYTLPNDPLTANKSTNEFKIETKSAEVNCDNGLKKQEIGHDKCLDLSQLTKLPQKVKIQFIFDQLCSGFLRTNFDILFHINSNQCANMTDLDIKRPSIEQNEYILIYTLQKYLLVCEEHTVS